MKPEKLVQHLTDTLRKTGYKVRTEEGNFRGGSCVFAEDRLVILNRRMSMEERAELLRSVLSGESLDGIFMVPEVRAFIEKSAKQPAETPAAESSDSPAAEPPSGES
jgi:hypothetical protein